MGIMRSRPLEEDAIIVAVQALGIGTVTMKSRIGTIGIVDMPSVEQLLRACKNHLKKTVIT